MRFLLLTILSLCLLTSSAMAGGFEITKVIEVGPAAWVPFTGPLRWSPDGTKLAYFAHNYLMISDTLGNSREVMKIDSGITPHRFEWVSNDKIAINMPQRRKSDSTLIKTITMVDIETKAHEVVVESGAAGGWKPANQRAGEDGFVGPFLSLEGNAYYLTRTRTGRTVKWERGRRAETIDEAHWLLPDKAPPMKDNHLVRWGADGLYKVALDQGDSVRLAGDPYQQAFGVVLSQDESHFVTHNLLVRVADSITVDPQSHSEGRPEGTFGCGLLFASFNPKATEMLFNRTCDGVSPSGSEFVVDQIATFDYDADELVIIDTVVGNYNCTAPVYAPDGKKIAFLDCDNYKAYIVYREVRK